MDEQAKKISSERKIVHAGDICVTSKHADGEPYIWGKLEIDCLSITKPIKPVTMGTTMSSVGLANKPPALPPVKQNNTAVIATAQSPPDYKFEHFTKLCQHYQEQKKILQVQIRTEVHNWKKVSENGDEGTECREKILGLLSQFREAQKQQDMLIEKEKLRLDAFRNCINEDTTNRIKKRLTFFQKLNKQHEALLEHIRQDIQECRMICKRFNDSSGRSKGFETWIKCPASPAYDYGSIGSL